MDKLILNFTPTGMIPTKKMTPHVPVSPNEIIEEVQQANNLGITMVHLHARDEEGLPTYKTDLYGEILEGLRKYCPDLITCISHSGRDFGEFEKRSEAMSLKADMGSLTLSSLNFPKSASVNSPEMVKKLALKMKENGIKPELEVFEPGMINYAKYLIRKGILEPPFYFNMLFGNIAGTQSDPAYIGLMIKDLPENSYWALAGIGNTQLSVNTLAIAYGGGVRVGLEDNIYFDQKREKLASNYALLERIHHLAEIFGRKIMEPKEFGELGFYNTNRV